MGCSGASSRTSGFQEKTRDRLRDRYQQNRESCTSGHRAIRGWPSCLYRCRCISGPTATAAKLSGFDHPITRFDTDPSLRFGISGKMLTISSPSEMTRLSQEAHRAGKRVGFVPTMGALHQGHISLVEAARAQCDVVVASIFV